MKNKNLILCLGAFSLLLNSGEVRAEGQYAGKERSTVAKAHMSRARTLLVEALEEFEEARKFARPDLLLDSEDWRLRVISLTEQLNRVIDPRPRITREGAVFRVPPRLVKRERDNLPIVADGAKSRSDFGEKERMESKQQGRARLFSKSGSGKEPLRVAKNNVNRSQLPDDLAVPDEPAIIKESNDPLKKRTILNEKALFTEELLPQMEANKDKENARKLIQQDKKAVVHEEESKEPDANQQKSDSQIEIIEEESVPARKALDSTVPNKAIEEEIQDEVQVIEKVPAENPSIDALRNDLESDYESKPVKPAELEKPTAESQPKEELEGQLEEEDLSPEQARKQLSEDDELAKRLEDTVYDRINSGN